MDVTVIIPAYNTEAYVAKAIRSVLQETDLLLEVLVVDDASTDHTAGVVEKLRAQDARVRLVRQSRNMGPSAARNRGLVEAQGRYVAFVDADDWCVPGRLKQLVQAADAAGADVISDNISLIDPGMEGPWTDVHTENGVRYGNGDPIRVLEFIRVGWIVQPVVRREFIESRTLRFDSSVDYGEDYILYVQMLLGGCRWIVWDEPLYVHLARPDSITHSHKVPQDLVRYLSERAQEMRRAGHVEIGRAFRHKRKRTAASLVLRNMLHHLKRREYAEAVVDAVRMVRYTNVYGDRFAKAVRRKRLKRSVPRAASRS